MAEEFKRRAAGWNAVEGAGALGCIAHFAARVRIACC